MPNCAVNKLLEREVLKWERSLSDRRALFDTPEEDPAYAPLPEDQAGESWQGPRDEEELHQDQDERQDNQHEHDPQDPDAQDPDAQDPDAQDPDAQDPDAQDPDAHHR